MTPLDLLLIVIGKGLSKDILHLANNILRGLAVLATLLKCFIFALLPNGDESGQITLIVGIRKWITKKVLRLL
jgi:hypothetical protein